MASRGRTNGKENGSYCIFGNPKLYGGCWRHPFLDEKEPLGLKIWGLGRGLGFRVPGLRFERRICGLCRGDIRPKSLNPNP